MRYAKRSLLQNKPWTHIIDLKCNFCKMEIYKVLIKCRFLNESSALRVKINEQCKAIEIELVGSLFRHILLDT